MCFPGSRTAADVAFDLSVQMLEQIFQILAQEIQLDSALSFKFTVCGRSRGKFRGIGACFKASDPPVVYSLETEQVEWVCEGA